MTRAHRALLIMLVTIATYGCSRSSARPEGEIVINGAGSTFAAPLYEEWGERFAKLHPGIHIEYDAVGSGDGQARFLQRAVDFGASDAPLTSEQLTGVDGGGLMIPVAAGGIVVAYNTKDLPDGLKLPRDVLADIFLGKITSWNDGRIAAANPGMNLPKHDISRIVRSDSSGTTQAFSGHLSSISDAWRSGPGTGKRVSWPGSFQTASGNDNVAGMVKMTDGAVGYIEYGTAKVAGLRMAALENKRGTFVAPSKESIRTAFSQGGAASLSVSADPDGEGSYPIVTGTWLLTYHRGDAKRMDALRSFVAWCLTDGQEAGEALGYVRLPEETLAAARQDAEGIGRKQ
jgi:phosphate transport system substrate-binding protein